jgi:hypothetical protein
MTIVHNHAQDILACDFFRHGDGQLSDAVPLRGSGNAPNRSLQRQRHPSAQWTLQLREVVTGEEPYQFPIHHRSASRIPAGEGSGSKSAQKITNDAISCEHTLKLCT